MSNTTNISIIFGLLVVLVFICSIGLLPTKGRFMAKKSNVVNLLKKQKFAVRNKSRCRLCGRGKAYMRRFGICRICFRELAMKGELPGVYKATW